MRRHPRWTFAVGVLALFAAHAHADVGGPVLVAGGRCPDGHAPADEGCRPAPCETDTDCAQGSSCHLWHVCTALHGGHEWLVSECSPQEHCGAWDVEQSVDRPPWLGPVPDADITCREGNYCIPVADLQPQPAPARDGIFHIVGCDCAIGAPGGTRTGAWAACIALAVFVVRRRSRSGATRSLW